MKDDFSVIVWLAAEKGKDDILEYLLSSYGDIVNINIQDKVHDVAFLPTYCISNHSLVWKVFFASSYSQRPMALSGDSPSPQNRRNASRQGIPCNDNPCTFL